MLSGALAAEGTGLEKGVKGVSLFMPFESPSRTAL